MNVQRRKMRFFRLFFLAIVAHQCRAEGIVGPFKIIKLCVIYLFDFKNVIGWFESDHEYHYSYSAQTISGVQEPASFGSSVGINANLVIQKSGGFAVAKVLHSIWKLIFVFLLLTFIYRFKKLSDVMLAVHNGPISLLNSIQYLKKKTELAPLEKPFKISFSRGKVEYRQLFF